MNEAGHQSSNWANRCQLVCKWDCGEKMFCWQGWSEVWSCVWSLEFGVVYGRGGGLRYPCFLTTQSLVQVRLQESLEDQSF